jgi:hypothetical protein
MKHDAADELVPDPQVRREFGGRSEMWTWRLDHDEKMAALGWPPPIRINRLKYRSRRALNEFRENLVRRAIAERAAPAAARKPGKITGAARRPRAPARWRATVTRNHRRPLVKGAGGSNKTGALRIPSSSPGQLALSPGIPRPAIVAGPP